MNNGFFSDLFESKGMRIASVSAVGLLALFLFAQTVATMQGLGRSGVPATDTITVQGSGRATLAPDVARVTFTVQNTAVTVAEAQAATTKQTNAAIDYVKGKGVAEKDLKTESYTISPQYAYPNPCVPGMVCPVYNSSPKITGYQVAQSIRVTVRDLTKVGDLLEGLGRLGVQNLYGPNFALDNENAGYDAARADAITKAKTQATLLAKELGVSLGKIVNFSESSGGGYPMTMSYGAGAMMDKAQAAPSLPAGENTYNASVSITYEIR